MKPPDEESRPATELDGLKAGSSTRSNGNPLDSQSLPIAYSLGTGKRILHMRETTISQQEVYDWVAGDPFELQSDKYKAGGFTFGSFKESPSGSCTREGCTGKSKNYRHRNIEAILARSAVTLDADSTLCVKDFVGKVRALGVSGVIYTSASSTKDLPKYRIILWVSRAMDLNEYWLVARSIMGTIGISAFDMAGARAENLMYRPATEHPEDFWSEVLTGEPIDVDSELGMAEIKGIADRPVRAVGAVGASSDRAAGTAYADLPSRVQEGVKEFLSAQQDAWRFKFKVAETWADHVREFPTESEPEGRGWELLCRDFEWAVASWLAAPWSGLTDDDASRIYDEVVPEEIREAEHCRAMFDPGVADEVLFKGAVDPCPEPRPTPEDVFDVEEPLVTAVDVPETDGFVAGERQCRAKVADPTGGWNRCSDPSRIGTLQGDAWYEDTCENHKDVPASDFAQDPGDRIHDAAVEKALEQLRVRDEARRLFQMERMSSEDSGSFVAGGSFILDIPEDTPAVWGEEDQVIWAKGEGIMLVGPPGVGKTTIAAQLLEGLILGGLSLFGLPIVEAAGRILYLAMDRPDQIARALARTLRHIDRETLDDRLVFRKGPPPADVADDPEILLAMATEMGASVIIVDSLKDAAVGLVEDRVGASYNKARQFCLANGVEVLDLHHLVKRGPDGKEPTTLADVYGSAWLTAGAGSVVLLWGQAGDPSVRLVHLKQPATPFGPVQIIHEHTQGRSWVDGDDVVDLHGLLKKAGTDGLTALRASLTLTGSKADKMKERQRRALNALVRAGKATYSDETGTGVWTAIDEDGSSSSLKVEAEDE